MKYDPALDGLRAVAVSAVVLYHVDSSILPGGWAGVDIFFVLSGFLITAILSREIDRTGTIDLKRFYLRRTLRLMPALWVFLLFCLILIAARPEWRHDGIRAVFFAATYTMNWNRAFQWCSMWKLGHTWSLSMEEQFYLVWPAIMLFTRRHLRMPVIISLLAAVITWRCFLAFNGADPERTYNGFDTHADALLIGSVLALNGMSRRPWRLPVVSLLASAAFITILLFVPLRTIGTQTAGLTAAALISMVLIICARERGWLRTILSLRALVYTGRISYGFYLWQQIFILLTYRHLPKWAMIVPVVGAYLTAMASYRWIERPLLRLKDRLHEPHAEAPPIGA
jgi:peptidoglycan/LPS O-acetylase OafA/YrhL